MGKFFIAFVFFSITKVSVSFSQDNVIMKNGNETINKDKVFDTYTTSFNRGIKDFNNKDWKSAFLSFSTTVKCYDIIFRNKWSTLTMPFDTTSMLYAGYSAQNAKYTVQAFQIYSQLIDNKVAGDANIDIYRYVLIFCSDNHDSFSFNHFLSLAKEMYLNQNWIDYELDFNKKNINR